LEETLSVISYSTFRSQLRRWGVTFVEHSRYDRCLNRSVPWYQHEARRSRDCARRGWDAHGIAIHHTGGPTSWTYVWDGDIAGRGIPGPLYIVEVYEDGVAHLTGWGVSNNVGACDRTVRDRAVAGNMPTSSEVRPGDDDYQAANSEFYGLAYRGTTPNSEQRATMRRICAAICEAHGPAWDGGSIAGHRELTRRKPDPEGEHMGQFRRDVNAMLANPPASSGGGSGGVTIPPPSGGGTDFDPEEDMPSIGEFKQAMRDVMAEGGGATPYLDGKFQGRDTALRRASINSGNAVNHIRYDVIPALAAIRAAQGGQPLDAAQVAQQVAALLLPEVRAEMRAELADVDGVDEDAVADKVVGRIGAALAAAGDATD
jgi:hypothetical protein